MDVSAVDAVAEVFDKQNEEALFGFFITVLVDADVGMVVHLQDIHTIQPLGNLVLIVVFLTIFDFQLEQIILSFGQKDNFLEIAGDSDNEGLDGLGLEYDDLLLVVVLLVDVEDLDTTLAIVHASDLAVEATLVVAMADDLEVQNLFVLISVNFEIGKLDHGDLVVRVQIDDRKVLLAVERQVLAVLVESQLVYLRQLLLVVEGHQWLVVVSNLVHDAKYGLRALQVVNI